jgi:hypothetical protein
MTGSTFGRAWLTRSIGCYRGWCTLARELDLTWTLRKVINLGYRVVRFDAGPGVWLGLRAGSRLRHIFYRRVMKEGRITSGT